MHAMFAIITENIFNQIEIDGKHTNTPSIYFLDTYVFGKGSFEIERAV